MGFIMMKTPPTNCRTPRHLVDDTIFEVLFKSSSNCTSNFTVRTCESLDAMSLCARKACRHAPCKYINARIYAYVYAYVYMHICTLT